MEKNDWFAVVFSIPSIALFYYFTLVTYNPYMLSDGLGIFCYGLFYLVFHDIIKVIAKPNYLGKFYVAFLFILIPFFIVNGILTGTGIEQEVVWYNDTENLGIRIGTIPFEDTFYGMLMILMNLSLFEGLQIKKSHRFSDNVVKLSPF